MAVDLSAVARWPNVPACYGWLALDRRGGWRLQGERVSHRGLIDFINRQYGCDDAGRWLLQNGPQRVYVSLAATPWIFHRAASGFLSHTGAPAGQIRGVLLDDGGNLLLDADLGIGLVDDRDLPGLFAECRDAAGQAASEQALLDLMAGQRPPLFWRQCRLEPIAAAELPARYGFVADPQP